MLIKKNCRNSGLLILSLLMLLFISSCSNKKVSKVDNNYLDQWNSFQTELIRTEKSFQKYKDLKNLDNDFKLVNYPSGDFTLKGLLNYKNIQAGVKRPILVYLHGGFALNSNELKITQEFTDRGYIVFAPSYRGENGNPGFTELFMGELSDAKAAIGWIAGQDYADIENIYTFGWSVGGGISLGLSLHNDVPIKLGGSSAGIYDSDLIKSWATEDDMIIFPYDYKNEKENYFRLPLYLLDLMVRPHFSYIGTEDGYDFVTKLKTQIYPNNDVLLSLIKVEGNHMSSLHKAVDLFLLEIEKIKIKK